MSMIDIYEEWYKYNEKGDPLYFENSRGETMTVENTYNEEGILLSAHLKESSGFERHIIYNDKRLIVKDEDNDGGKREYEYDENGNEIRCENEDGYIIWREYDEKGNCIHMKDNNGDEYRTEYDEYNNIIKETFIVSGKKYEFKEEYKYDERGNVIFHKDVDGFISLWDYKYNEDGTYESVYKDDEIESIKKFDINGREIYQKTTELEDNSYFERWNEYDERGNLIHLKNSKGLEIWKEYNEDGKLIHHKSVGMFYRVK